MTKKLPTLLWFWILIIILLKLVIASGIELGNDEVYYWTYALHPEWNYFDHPPFVAWLIRFSTGNLILHSTLSVRLGAIFFSAISTIFVYLIGKHIGNSRTAWFAVMLYSASFYFSIIAGTFILPDSPQLLFWFVAIYLILQLASQKQQNNLFIWILFGLTTGFCMLCKVHGIFLWLSMFLFGFFKRPQLFKITGFYVAIFISFIVFSPVIIWNIQHHFITYTYHSDRVSLLHARLNPLSFFRMLGGEAFYQNIVVFIFTWIGVFYVWSQKRIRQMDSTWILLCSGLPLWIMLMVFSLFRDTLPHWSGPAYCSLLFFGAIRLADYPLKRGIRWMYIAGFIFMLTVASGMLLINYYPGTLSAEKSKLMLGKGDPTLDLYGWAKTGELVNTLYQAEQRAGLSKIKKMVVSKWFPAAHLDFYVGQKTGLETFGIGAPFDLHQYYWSNQYKRKLLRGEDAYYIIPSNLYEQESLNQIKAHFKGLTSPKIIPVYRGREVCKYIMVFRLLGYKG